MKTSIPAKALLSEFQAAGVPLTVGSDAHHASRIGAHIEDAYQFARKRRILIY